MVGVFHAVGIRSGSPTPSPVCYTFWASLTSTVPVWGKGGYQPTVVSPQPFLLASGVRPHPPPTSRYSSSFSGQPNDSCLPERGLECRGQASSEAPATETQYLHKSLPQPGRVAPARACLPSCLLNGPPQGTSNVCPRQPRQAALEPKLWLGAQETLGLHSTWYSL